MAPETPSPDPTATDQPRRLILVTRQSPDWAALAADYRAGRAIDRARFRPDPSVPGFPDDLFALIDLWNERFAVDFFTCRARLKQIADMMLARIPLVRRVDFQAFREQGPGEGDALVFFHDDDDWFSPALSAQAQTLPLDRMDVVVFPLVRLWILTVTFVHPGFPVRDVVGRPSRFAFRYHTNNYGVSARVCQGDVIDGMREHIPASAFAESRNFRDFYINAPLGCTIKTPCSASMMAELKKPENEGRQLVVRFIDAMEALTIPPEAEWIRDGLNLTLDLFRDAAGRGERIG
ncbi:hypothetical protein [Rhodoblastus sp.]|uniref:hypothetical protein n=1 Tax=Rhodoblastus sp. TaxID=1962975 RepID=UPI003F993A16